MTRLYFIQPKSFDDRESAPSDRTPFEDEPHEARRKTGESSTADFRAHAKPHHARHNFPPSPLPRPSKTPNSGDQLAKSTITKWCDLLFIRETGLRFGVVPNRAGTEERIKIREDEEEEERRRKA